MTRKVRFKPTLQGYAQSAPETREEPHREQFTLRLVTALRGGGNSVEDLPATFAYTTAQRQADRIQAEYDREAAPVRVYMIDSTGVAVYRGGARAEPTSDHEARRIP